MPQTAMTVDAAVGVPGLLFGMDNKVDTCIANEAIPPGRVVCRDATTGRIFLPKADADLAFVYGISVFEDTKMQAASGGFVPAQYDVVPVLRSGKIYAAFSGGTAAYGARFNVKDDAATVATQGMVSATAPATDTIGALPTGVIGRGVFSRAAATTALALVEINFP